MAPRAEWEEEGDLTDPQIDAAGALPGFSLPFRLGAACADAHEPLAIKRLREAAAVDRAQGSIP